MVCCHEKGIKSGISFQFSKERLMCLVTYLLDNKCRPINYNFSWINKEGRIKRDQILISHWDS